MKNIKIDIYKSIFLLILGVSVYCYFQNSQNGRFNFINDTESGDMMILDTKSGTTYIIEVDNIGNKKAIINTPSIIK